MPFPMKIQPLDLASIAKAEAAPATKPVVKSRLKRLLERQLAGVLRSSSSDKLEQQWAKDSTGGGGCGEFDPSSVCLAKMVQNFIEDNNEKQQSKCSRNRCNCFNGNCNDLSDGEFDGPSVAADVSSLAACEILKSMVPCATIAERNLLVDTAKIVEKNKICKRKDDYRAIVANGLQSLGHDASICKSRWEKSQSFPAGEYEYIDAIVEGQRLLIDIDFKSEFEIARSTKHYRAILQCLPSIFVGKPDRLRQIVAVVSEAAKQSLKKKGLHFPPWRKPEYMIAKWLSPNERLRTPLAFPCSIQTRNFSGEFELIFGDKKSSPENNNDPSAPPATSAAPSPSQEKITVVVSAWQPPAVKPRASGSRVVPGLASVLRDKP